MSLHQHNELVQPSIVWNDKEAIVTYSQGSEFHTFTYAQLEWEGSFLKHKPGPLTEVLRKYQQRQRAGKRR